MFSFAHIEYLYLLLLLPVVVVLFLMARRSRSRKLARFGRLAVVGDLMPDVSKYKPWIRLTVQLLLLAVVIIILARPRGGAKMTNTTVHGVEVMIALDVSNSMNDARDYNVQGISRLQRSKLVLEKLIDQLAGNKVGLVVFAGNAYMQMPLTADAQSAKMFLNGISTDMVPTQGTAIGAAVNMARRSFSKNPHTQKSIIVITDGENFEDDAIAAAKDAHKDGIQVNVVGIGSTTGSPIPMENGQYLTDDEGKQVNTKLNEEVAQKIAQAGEGAYVNGSSSEAVSDLHESLKKLSKSDLGSYTYTKQDEQFSVFAWIALLLIIAELLVIDRKNPFLKRYNFFTKGGKK